MTFFTSIDREESNTGTVLVSWGRVWKLNYPEYWLIALGLLSAIIQGTIYPAFAYFFGQVLRVFTFPFNLVLENIHQWAGMFLVLGTVSGLATFIKVSVRKS